MALVTGPLHSMEAHGALGSTLIYERWKGHTYVKPWKAPTVRRYPSQRAVRAIMRFLTDEWENTLTTEKSSWAALAIAANTQPINEFCRYNFDRLWTNRGASKEYPATEISEPPQPNITNAVGGVGQIELNADWLTYQEGWATIAYIRTGEGEVTPKMIGAIFQPGLEWSPNYFTVKNVEPGTYQCYFAFFHIDATLQETLNGPYEAIVT